MISKVWQIFFLLLSFLGTTSEAQGLLNLDVAKARVRNYYESGHYSSQLDSIVRKAEKEIEAKELSENSVVIFDVDDTALSTYEYTKHLGFGFTWETWIEWMKGEESKAIPEIKKFYEFLKHRKIKVFFLTGRDSSLCIFTKENLLKEGYSGYDSLICRGWKHQNETAAKFKEKVRQSLVRNGFEIIASVGDQESDVAGKFTGIKIKLPNYLYLIK